MTIADCKRARKRLIRRYGDKLNRGARSVAQAMEYERRKAATAKKIKK